MKTRIIPIIGIGAVCFALTAGACTNAQQDAAQAAQDKAANHRAYIPKNDIEFKNYEKRQIIADNPQTILWCTASFPNSTSPIFTFPIVGKLTSSTKRPDNTDPGADGMYGSSTEYRFGFTPDGQYVDFTGMATVCTTEPQIWQRQSIALTLGTDPKLLEAQKQAQALLKAGDTTGAQKALQDASK